MRLSLDPASLTSRQIISVYSKSPSTVLQSPTNLRTLGIDLDDGHFHQDSTHSSFEHPVRLPRTPLPFPVSPGHCSNRTSSRSPHIVPSRPAPSVVSGYRCHRAHGGRLDGHVRPTERLAAERIQRPRAVGRGGRGGAVGKDPRGLRGDGSARALRPERWRASSCAAVRYCIGESRRDGGSGPFGRGGGSRLPDLARKSRRIGQRLRKRSNEEAEGRSREEGSGWLELAARRGTLW